MKLYYHDQFVLPLPEGHRFPMPKYVLLRQRVVEAGLVAAENLLVGPAATHEELHRAHIFMLRFGLAEVMLLAKAVPITQLRKTRMAGHLQPPIKIGALCPQLIQDGYGRLCQNGNGSKNHGKLYKKRK